MADQKPAAFVNSIKKSGLLVVRKGTYYFIPLETMRKCMFPSPFQKDYAEISEDYFEKENAPGAPTGQGAAAAARPRANEQLRGQVYKEIDKLLGRLRVADGISQAVWIDVQEKDGDKTFSRSEESRQVLFQYSDDGKKILVDMSKGGKPSTDF